MFNQSVVSSSVQNQFPVFYQDQYPTLVKFLQSYYEFLESNGNPIDLINGLLDITDIDTYAEIDLRASTKEPISITDTEISVIGHVKFPRTDGLLKIDDEVILYKEREYITDEFNVYKITVFKGCIRGYTYNDLTYEDGFVPNIETQPAKHIASSVVVNQSFSYLLYFLDKLRQQFLVNYPQNSLIENKDKLNFNLILKRIKDFYLSKGTPKGIEFYFKYLFQNVPEITNYKSQLLAPSDAIYQTKFIVRTESLDNYYIPDLVDKTLVQNGKEFNVQTVENNFAASSQVYELELSNGQNIVPTQFAIITQYIINNRLYVDTTFGFSEIGFLRIGDDIVEYTRKEYNYFELKELPNFYVIGQRIYDLSTLASVKDRPDSYFLIFAGVTGYDILKNYTYYQEGDIGFVKDVSINVSNLLLTSWVTNENIPVKLNKNLVAGVASLYTDQESVYLYSSGIPYYSFSAPSNVQILDAEHFVRIPLIYTKSLEGFREKTTPDAPVGFLVDGTPILNWKSNVVITRGSLKTVTVVDGGSDFNVNIPPVITFSPPKLTGGTTAVGNLIINGSIKEVYVESSGKGYPTSTIITVDKDPTDTEFNSKFRPAVLEPVVVKGKITRVKIIDPGYGYSKQPTIRISPNFFNDANPNTEEAVITSLVTGPISRVNITNPGSKYDSDPSILTTFGEGATAVITIQNGTITEITPVNNGQNYKSAPIVSIVDSTGKGQGAVIISKINNVTGAVIGYKILNGGINYSQFGTVVQIFESGTDALLNPIVDSWTLLNNYNTNNDVNYDSSTGGLLFGTETLQNVETIVPTFEEIPYQLNTQVSQSGLLSVVYDGITYPASPPILDTISEAGFDLIDDGYITLTAPFDIRFGTTSNTPTLVKKGEKFYISTNGFIFFNEGSPLALAGWAAEQLTPTSLGASIQIGKDDLIIDRLFEAPVERSSVINVAIVASVLGATSTNNWPSPNTAGLYFNGPTTRSFTTQEFNTLNGGYFKFDLIYSSPSTIGESPESGEQVQLQYSKNNGSNWTPVDNYSTVTYGGGTWKTISVQLQGVLADPSIRLRLIQPTYTRTGGIFDTWGLDNVAMQLKTITQVPDLYALRYEGFHFVRGLNRTNPIKFEIIFEENISGLIVDNKFTINIIENNPLPSDLKTLLLTYGENNSYEFDPVPVESGKSYRYSNTIIPASSSVFPKKYNVIGAPKQLKLKGSLVNVNLTDTTKHSPIIGWSLDGCPIYGPYGYENPLEESDIKKMVSGWKKIEINLNPIRLLPSLNGGLQNYALGSFEEDYYWSPSQSTLDKQNGRYCVTPEFPDGVYAYFMTVDYNNKQLGFPYFVGSEFSGKTYSEFNLSEVPLLYKISNLTRYLDPTTGIYEKTRPLDPGSFTVESIPSSTDASVKSINIVDGGSGYKVGDKLVFNNTGTSGFGAAGFVSVIEGKDIISTTFTQYDYLEYYDETTPFSNGSTIKTADGFSAVIHSVNQNEKYAYLENVTGTNPSSGEVIYDSTLTPEVLISNEITGVDGTVTVISGLETKCTLDSSIDSATTYLSVSGFTNCTINDFFSPTINKYIKIDDEYMLVKYKASSNNILVERGINSIQTTHASGSTVTLLSELPVFDSSKFNIGDIIKVDDEIFKVVNITVTKTTQKLFTKINDGSGTSGANTYYLFINGVLQINSSAQVPSQGTVILNANGDVSDLIFNQPPNQTGVTVDGSILSNPKIEILTSQTYIKSNIVANIDIIGSNFVHTLTVERQAFSTLRSLHYPRSIVTKLRYINAKVKSYEQDRILSRFTSSGNGLVQGDHVTVSASKKIENNYNINFTSNPINFAITKGSETYGSGSTIVMYERSRYIFNIQSTEPTTVQFFSFSTELDKQKEYFDIDNAIELDGTGKITKFTIVPKSSDLTNVIMRITLQSQGIYRDVNLNIRFEPYNGEFLVENSTLSYFEFYIDRDPLFTDYTSNTINYITTSKTASGSIYKSTLTSGGFDYKILPSITGFVTGNGVGATLEAFSDTVGSVKSITKASNGYGYSPNPSYAPIISFPIIAKLKNNYKVVSYRIDDPGDGYLFSNTPVIKGGGLGDGDSQHASLIVNVNNEKVISVDILYSGVSYSSAPTVDVEKTYFTTINSNGDLAFKFNFNNYFRENDSYKVRAYYLDTNSNLKYQESSVTFFADLQTASIKSKLTLASQTYVNPLDYISLPANVQVQYYKVVLNERKASITLIIDKSNFFAGEKVIINDNPNIIGYVSLIEGWQKNNSILRITGLQYELKINDIIRGVNSESYGKVDFVDGVNTSLKLGAYLEQPKLFLTQDSFLGENIFKLQDSFRYQKFAYEISSNIPVDKWRENYISTAHPAGYNLFAKTKINQRVKLPVDSSTTVKVSTDVSSIVRLNQKYNYLITKNISIDESQVANKLLTDVKNIKTSVVAAFQDFSSEFDGIKTSFELKVIDPIQPKELDGVTDRYITNYNIDQMLVLLDNIVQTYEISWTVTDADKAFSFESVETSGQLMPGGDILYYRQLNEGNTIYGFNKLTTTPSTTFSLVEQDQTPFPSAVLGGNYNVQDWLVFVDGVLQLSGSSYSVSTSQLVFDETIPAGTQISARCILNSHRNQFVNGTYIQGNVISLTSKPVTATKESYFVFVDGVLIQTSDYNLDASNNIIFEYSFNYDSLVVFIDSKLVSLETSSHNILNELYTYKIEDGQTDIPVGLVINSNQYILDINGVVQTPFISYVAGSSGVRKINFTEPPQKYIKGDIEVGRQFIGLLYQREDVSGSLGSTPNYQFDDISRNIIFVKNNISNLVVGDYVVSPTNNSNAIVDNIIDKQIRKTVIQSVSSTVIAANATLVILLNSVSELSVGDRVIFDPAIGLTSIDGNQLEITSINKINSTVTLKNISASSLTIALTLNNSIRFSHRELIVVKINTSEVNRDNAFTSNTTLLSGYVSSSETTTQTTLNESYMVLSSDTTINVVSSTGFANNDYILVNDVEVMKITNISSNVLTVSRGQLASIIPNVHPNGSNVTKIIPVSLECSGFIRGFDSNKTIFPLLKNGNPVYIEANKDIFVIVNGILQKRGLSYTVIENNPNGIPNSGDEYSEIQFTEPPSDSTPFNCFYVGETISIQNIASQFNGVRTSFDLRSVTGEIFSLISNNRPEANISANLILFIDGVYQIPSTTESGRLEAYSDLLSSYKLLGSVIDFNSPPKRGSDFEGYIFVGSQSDYNTIDIDVSVEANDILLQYNEVSPRRILQKTSATKLSVTESFGVISTASNGIELGSDRGNNWWKTDLIKFARVRESLRSRRSIHSTIFEIGTPSPYPLTGKILYTTSIPSIKVNNISSDFPTSPDDDTNKISFIIPAGSNFPERMVDFTYVSFVPRNPLVVGSKDELQNLKIVNLPFNQILKVSGSASDLSSYYFAGNSNTSEFSVVNFDILNKIVYIKLTDPSKPVTTTNWTNFFGYTLTIDNLINEYQTLTVGTKLIYNF